MKKNLVYPPPRQAALQRLVWSRGHAATWRTVAVFSTCAEAERTLLRSCRDQELRVLLDLRSAMKVGALTRDSRLGGARC